MATQWNKAVIFTEKAILAVKNCNTNIQELSAYFSAYESRDNTIGKGTYLDEQASCCRATTLTCIGSTRHWCTDGEAMRRTGRASVWRWGRRSRGRKYTC